jgi:hypothetical protein
LSGTRDTDVVLDFFGLREVDASLTVGFETSSPNLATRTPVRHKTFRNSNKDRPVFAAVVLDFAASAQLRDQMLSELNDIGSADEAANWARRRLAEKNKLNTDDARHVEEIFRAKLLSFAIHRADGLSQSDDDQGDEAGWWKNAGVDPTSATRALWLQTHPLVTEPGDRACGGDPQARSGV